VNCYNKHVCFSLTPTVPLRHHKIPRSVLAVRQLNSDCKLGFKHTTCLYVCVQSSAKTLKPGDIYMRHLCDAQKLYVLPTVYICVCIFMYVCMYVCVYVCMYVMCVCMYVMCVCTRMYVMYVCTLCDSHKHCSPFPLPHWEFW